MAYELGLECITIPAAADLSASQYLFMAIDSNGNVNVSSTAAGSADGVLQNKPDALGRPATIAVDGVTKLVASAAIAAGDKIGIATGGKARTATTGDRVLGRAMEAAAANNDIFPCLLKLGGEPNA